jgi:hypothetical protein
MWETNIRWAERVLGAAILARRYRQKIKSVSRQLPVVDEPGLEAAVSKRFDGYSCDLWHKVYAAASGRRSIDYLPEDLFYNVFESRLNPRHRKEPYKDKNYYDRLNWPCLPQTIFRIVNGRLVDRSYRMIDVDTALRLARETELPEFVAKPARQTGGGFQVAFLDLAALVAFIPANMKPHSDWIFQHLIRQHEVMARLNASSVNTLRIITIRMSAEVSVVSSFIRIGTKGKRVDNLSAGGNIAVGVEADGKLSKFGYDDNLQRSTVHPDHGYAFDSFTIPSFAAARQACIRLHATVPDLDLLSWDVAIDDLGMPVVIEVNIRRQDINTTQVCSGPVLNPYIDAVLARHKWLMIPGVGAIDCRIEVAPDLAADDQSTGR